MELTEELEAAVEELLKAIERFDQAEFNKVPFEGSWTADEVAEHVFISASGVLRGLSGTKGYTQRDPSQFVPNLREAFLNFDQNAIA